MSKQSRYSRKARGLFIERDGDLDNRVIEMPLSTTRRRVREWKSFYERYGYETAWGEDGNAVNVFMPGWTRTFEAVAL